VRGVGRLVRPGPRGAVPVGLKAVVGGAALLAARQGGRDRRPSGPRGGGSGGGGPGPGLARGRVRHPPDLRAGVRSAPVPQGPTAHPGRGRRNLEVLAAVPDPGRRPAVASEGRPHDLRARRVALRLDLEIRRLRPSAGMPGRGQEAARRVRGRPGGGLRPARADPRAVLLLRTPLERRAIDGGRVWGDLRRKLGPRMGGV
jgi:hypothetical protein